MNNNKKKILEDGIEYFALGTFSSYLLVRLKQKTKVKLQNFLSKILYGKKSVLLQKTEIFQLLIFK